MKRIPLLILILNLLLALTGCSDYEMYQFVKTQQDARSVAPAFDAANDTITIASWNIQVFGKTKAAKPEVMETIVKVISRFDIVAIQEIRDESGTAIMRLENMLDATGTDYNYFIGPRLGRTSSKEQYAYMYRTDRVEPTMSYTWEDRADIYHREPFIAGFRSKIGNFDFQLVQIHVDPDDAEDEIARFGILMWILWDEEINKTGHPEDFIFLGDMNADCGYFNEMYWDLGWDHPVPPEWLITNEMDTTVGANSCTYDRIIITKNTTSEDWTGKAGVYRFDEILGLSPDQAKAVSDHYPVWATFHTDRDTD